MKVFVALFALVAVAAAQVSNEYLPPNYEVASDVHHEVVAAAPVVSYETVETAAAEPAHSFTEAEGYRYKTNRRRVIRRNRRDVSTEYLPPVASAPEASYSVVETAPATVVESYETADAAPAHSFTEAEGYRYKTNRRRVIRRNRRDVSSEYLPPVASAPEASYSVVETAPATVVESYETAAAAAPAHSFSDDEGYRYKTVRRRVIRRNRRDISSEYLPPVASAPEASYSVVESAPATVVETYETAAAAAPAHSFSDDEGYRYKTVRRRVIRRNRRDVSTEYLPPVASAPEASYSVVETAPATVVESYETAAAAPAHSFTEAEGYRYKTNRRRVIRRNRRDVSSEYLPPVASAPEASYSVVETAPATVVESYETAAAAPAHSFTEAEGYRYKTNRRRVIRRNRRDVSSEYLPPVASAPEAAYSSISYASPAASYTVEVGAPAAAVETFETAAAAPAHTFSEDEGYRYKTVRRRVIRRNRY